MNDLYIGFDFSINKPAMTVYYQGIIDFFIWPLKQNKKDFEMYKDNHVYSVNRNLNSINSKMYTSSELTKIHTERSKFLADLIVETIFRYMDDNHISRDTGVHIASEGLSFGSVGDATLNLATYKGVLLVKLIENFNIKNLYTFSPVSIKALAGCATKEKRKDKNAMIYAFIKEDFINEHKFHKNVKTFIKKKNFAACVDDIVDSYWALKKMLVELEKI